MTKIAETKFGKEMIDSEIEHLYKDYMNSKEVFLDVLDMYSGVLAPIDEDSLEDEIEKDIL